MYHMVQTKAPPPPTTKKDILKLTLKGSNIQVTQAILEQLERT